MKGPVVLFVGDALAGQSGLPVLRLACMSVGHEAVGARGREHGVSRSLTRVGGRGCRRR